MQVKPHLLKHRTADGFLIEIPIIKPSEWLRCLVQQDMTLLSGGAQDFESQFWSFWKCFQCVSPGHDIYRSGDEDLLKRTVPLVLFGDEGRYLKKGNFMLATVESVLGHSPTQLQECHCRSDPALERYNLAEANCDESVLQAAAIAAKQYTNFTGHCYLSKLVCFGMKSQLYKKHPLLLEEAFELVAQDLQELHTKGVVVSGKVFHASTIGIKGDLKFHHQLGHLTCSYYNVGSTNENPMCSFCWAGAQGFPFENLSLDAEWRSTVFSQRPWNEASPPQITLIPGDRVAPEASFRLDVFHIWKLGVARDAVGSLIIQLCNLGYFDFSDDDAQNIDNRLQRAWSHFYLYCRAEGHTPSLHYFSKSLFCITNFRQYPWVNCKASDSTLLTGWLIFFISMLKRNSTVKLEHNLLMDAALETLEASTSLFRTLYGHHLWLERPCAQRCHHYLRVMLHGYKFMAKEAKLLGLVAFSLKPKFHALDHLCRDLSDQLATGAPLVLSPLAFACECNEDAVGKVSRLARRVSSTCVSLRVLERVSIKMKTLLRKRRSTR